MGFLHDVVDAGIWTVRFVDGDDHRQLCFQSLGENESSLWQWTFGGVDKQHYAVNHRDSALDLTTEVSVARGVDDVNNKVGAVFTQPLTTDRSVFREDRNATLFFLVIRVHDAIIDFAMFTERTGLFEHSVDERGFAMVDVCDDCDVAELSVHSTPERLWVLTLQRYSPCSRHASFLIAPSPASSNPNPVNRQQHNPQCGKQPDK